MVNKGFVCEECWHSHAKKYSLFHLIEDADNSRSKLHNTKIVKKKSMKEINLQDDSSSSSSESSQKFLILMRIIIVI